MNYWVQIVPVPIQTISCTPRWADYISVFLKNLLSQYSLLIRVLASTLCFLSPPSSYTQPFMEYRGFSRHWGPFLLSNILSFVETVLFLLDHYGLFTLLRCREIGNGIQVPSFYTFLVYSLLSNLLLLVYCLT